jgi:hypothetical protein
MAVQRFSHAAAKALLLLGKNTRQAARQAYGLMADELGKPAGNKVARNWAVYSRVLSEMWRNGWVSIVGHAPNKAVSAATTGVGLDERDYYTHWLLAYALKTRARFADHYKSSWAQDVGLAMKHYDRARGLLAAEKKKSPSDVVAGDLNAVTFDWAESFVYTGNPARAVAEMERVVRDPRRAKPQDWQDWAYAFALHQTGRYIEAIGICEGLLQAKDANNDIRVLLAACEARSHLSMKANDTAGEFHRRRRPASAAPIEDWEPTWSVALEIERGAFPPDLPGEGEKDWADSLRRARLDESAPGPSRPQENFLRPTEPTLDKKDRRGGAEAARKPAKRPARKKAAKKKSAKKKAAKRKAAKRKPARKSAKRKIARKSAKRRGRRRSAKRKR